MIPSFHATCYANNLSYSYLKNCIMSPELFTNILDFEILPYDPMLSDVHNAIYLEMSSKDMPVVGNINVDIDDSSVVTKCKWENDKYREFNDCIDEAVIHSIVVKLKEIDTDLIDNIVVNSIVDECNSLILQAASKCDLLLEKKVIRKVDNSLKKKGPEKLTSPVNVLRKILLGDKGQYKCNEGFSYNRLTGKCEDDDERSNLSEKPAKPIDPANVLRKLLLGDRGQIQCIKEGFSYNRMTGKCEDADERFNSLERPDKSGENLIDLRNLLLEVRKEKPCKEGHSYNKLTDKCEKNKDLHIPYKVGNGCCNNGTPGR
ncbi:Hypothetical predicted protein [Mytilus galloprovincialis]|uniref:Uncharacterized protein n=1 Tax=Mytilus galloprovincialis TaxID=29158 RepID=A0A8B6F0B8_MYTGA|nr:Hypothetical predicted protein [Mytilus galloprovincialis]